MDLDCKQYACHFGRKGTYVDIATVLHFVFGYVTIGRICNGVVEAD